jgi:hypothetical protein
MAGFEVTSYGRFWVTAKAARQGDLRVALFFVLEWIPFRKKSRITIDDLRVYGAHQQKCLN